MAPCKRTLGLAATASWLLAVNLLIVGLVLGVREAADQNVTELQALLANNLTSDDHAPDPEFPHMKSPADVYANIYDVGSGSRKYNNWSPRGGIYHIGVEVYGVEWEFGHTDFGTGIGSRIAKHMEPGEFVGMHQFRESKWLGTTLWKKKDIDELIAQLKSSGDWDGRSYDLIKKNCIVFVREVLNTILDDGEAELKAKAAYASRWMDTANWLSPALGAIGGAFGALSTAGSDVSEAAIEGSQHVAGAIQDWRDDPARQPVFANAQPIPPHYPYPQYPPQYPRPQYPQGQHGPQHVHAPGHGYAPGQYGPGLGQLAGGHPRAGPRGYYQP